MIFRAVDKFIKMRLDSEGIIYVRVLSNSFLCVLDPFDIAISVVKLDHIT